MNTIGKNVVISVFGESHSDKITLIMEGIKPGTEISLDKIREDLKIRNPHFSFNTQRKEEDNFLVESGFDGEKTDGHDIVISVKNIAIDKKDYNPNDVFLRPSHSDYTRIAKYGLKSITSGGGSSSGRMTLPLVILGSISKQILAKQGVEIVSHIQSVGGLSEDRFNTENLASYRKNKEYDEFFPTINSDYHNQCLDLLNKTKNEKDSIGCTIETAIMGIKAGVGSPFFNSIESEISHLVFAIPAIKGIEFGDGFEFAKAKGSEVEDAFFYDSKDEAIKTKSNHNGGINGGISNGMPIIFRVVVKPTPTIGQPLTSLNYLTKETETKTYTGNHDSFIGNRALLAIEGVAAFAILDLIYDKDKSED